jgi:hypothetical protein
MAVTLILSALAAVALYSLNSTYRNLKRNIALAKSSGLPIVVAPWNFFSVFWLASHTLWTPLVKQVLRFLPASFYGLWVEYV